MTVITMTARTGDLVQVVTKEPYAVVQDRLYFRAPNMEVTNRETGLKMCINKCYIVYIEEEADDPQHQTRSYRPGGACADYYRPDQEQGGFSATLPDRP